MWWVVLVLLSCQDRELAVGAGVGPSRGRRSEDSGGPRGAEPLTRADEAERRGRFGDPPEATRRAKRGFTYPGTLWCGAGNMADHYDQLGRTLPTDRCCRTHDHCPHVIHAFSSKYGHTNFKWHSISHCDCDEALKGCLRRANDTSSRVVGQAFFNVIGAPCFQLVYEERCAERRWYGPPRTHSAGAPGVSSALTVQIPKSAVRPTDLQSVLSIQVVPTSQQVPREEISQSAIDSKSSPSATSTPASQAQRGPASSGSTVQPVRQKPTVPGPPGTPEVKRNRSGERGDSEGRKKERKARPHPGAPSVTPAGPTQSRDIVPAVGIRKRQMSGRSAQRMKAASESVPLASLASSAAAADPFGSLARRTGPRKLGRNAALVNAHRGFATSEFPNLTSAPEEGAEKRRAGVSAARLASAVRRSMERAEERFAWKKRRKATGSIRPH
uniref:Mediator of DNA damage checkpoint protein 1-like n=1 Tax=Hippocampus comes TaxID=109280 RepID=A0A3Q2YFD4_HIPCM